MAVDPGSGKVKQSLSRQILVWVSAIGVVFVVSTTVFSYIATYRQALESTFSYLEQYMLERRNHENAFFDRADAYLNIFRDEFMAMYLSDIQFSEEDFWELYFVDSDGATRMKPEYFEERYDALLGRQYGVSSFIGNNQSVDSPDLQRRLIIAYILVNRFGPAWWNILGGLHVSYPENAITVFYPPAPWGLQAKPDLPMNELGVIKATLQENNPERKPVWTGLYYDETVGNWTITYEVPVDLDGRHLINPSLDVKLESIMERLISDHPEEAYNFLIRDDGYLVAHPLEPTEEQKWMGLLSLEEIENPDIVRMYQLIRSEARVPPYEELYSLEDEDTGNYVLATFLTGPEWWLVLVYPKALILDEARNASGLVLILGLSILILYYAAIVVIITRKVRDPLRTLQKAVYWISDGRYNEVAENPGLLPLTQNNEIGGLASTFFEMAVQVRDVNRNLGDIVEARTRELEEANSRLRKLSLLDGLTNIHNRRSFDKDIDFIFQQAKAGVESFALMMADVDLFKKYNDTYGHTSGDKVLRRLADVIAACIRSEDRVYRYGGEELAILFNNADMDSSRGLCNRIFAAVRGCAIQHKTSRHKIVTISAGLVEFDRAFRNATDMIDVADFRLYLAKSRGRNQFQISGQSDRREV